MQERVIRRLEGLLEAKLKRETKKDGEGPEGT
jgi:hypothetical protein